MTVTEKLADFAATLNQRIESAMSCVSDADAFLKANQEIETLMTEVWPQIVASFEDGKPGTDDHELLASMAAALAELEEQARARLVWAGDFEDYMRDALIKR